jgi:uncharacterized protein
VHEPLPTLPEDPARGGFRQLFRDFFALDRGALVILVAAPVLLTLLDYFGLPWHYTRLSERRHEGFMGVSPPRAPDLAKALGNPELIGPPSLWPFVWWGIAVLLTMIILPILIAWIGAGLKPRDIGLKVKGTLRDARIYLVLYLIFLPVVWLVSQSPDFQRTYPFYPQARLGKLGSDFWMFEGIYCLQFLGVELFFRGFLVLGLKRALGLASVLVMLAPYCMIHFYKPIPEALGSIGAGLVLGLLAWRTGTIVYGWFLHYAVALSMDLLALHQTGRL